MAFGCFVDFDGFRMGAGVNIVGERCGGGINRLGIISGTRNCESRMQNVDDSCEVCNQSRPEYFTHRQTHIHKHRHTQRDTETHTQLHRHTQSNTHTYKHKHTHTHINTHMSYTKQVCRLFNSKLLSSTKRR